MLYVFCQLDLIPPENYPALTLISCYVGVAVGVIIGLIIIVGVVVVSLWFVRR